jgi:hypothetical protein
MNYQSEAILLIAPSAKKDFSVILLNYILANRILIMRKAFILIINFLSFSCLYGQGLRNPISAGYIGLGAYTLNHVDAFSFSSNQAALAQMNDFAFGVYGEKRFLLDATNFYSAVVVMPSKNGNFGLQADYFGFKDYNESQIGLAYARSLGKKVDIGVKFNYYGFHIPSYGNASTVDFELGAIAHLTDKLNAGIHAYNPIGGTFSKGDNEKLSSIYKFGLGYEASKSFFASGEIVKEENMPVNVNVGFQYNFDKRFFVRAGVATATNIYYAGAGISWKNIRLDVNSSYHSPLGFSPGLLLIIKSEKKKKNDHK